MEALLGGFEFILWITFIYLLASPRVTAWIYFLQAWADEKIEKHRP